MAVASFNKFLLLCAIYAGVKCMGEKYNNLNYFYKELGCVKNEKHPQAYVCPEFPPKDGSCRFYNKFFKKGEYIDRELLKGTCYPECYCNDDGLILCAIGDCAYYQQEGCHLSYSLDACCPGKPICGDDIAICEIEGKTYKEGEKVQLKESCEVCVCNKGFKKEAPFCRPVKCGLEVSSGYSLKDHSAAVYLKGETCCPSNWITDDKKDEIQTFTNAAEDIACKFGNRDINLGQGFYRNMSQYGVEAQLKCECSSPPIVICQEI